MPTPFSSTLKNDNIMINSDLKKIGPDPTDETTPTKMRSTTSTTNISGQMLEVFQSTPEEEISEGKSFLTKLHVQFWRTSTRRRSRTAIGRHQFYFHPTDFVLDLQYRSIFQISPKLFFHSFKRPQISAENISSSNRFLCDSELF